jgi:hypothetical protein
MFLSGDAVITLLRIIPAPNRTRISKSAARFSGVPPTRY